MPLTYTVVCTYCLAGCTDAITVRVDDKRVLSELVSRRHISNGHCARNGGLLPEKKKGGKTE